MNEWNERARCRGQPLSPFFNGPKAKAVAMCTECPVAWECVSFAIDNGMFDYETGIWGGLDPAERYDFARKAYRYSAVAARVDHHRMLARQRTNA